VRLFYCPRHAGVFTSGAIVRKEKIKQVLIKAAIHIATTLIVQLIKHYLF